MPDASLKPPKSNPLPRDHVGALAKGLAVLEILAAHSQGQTLTDVAARAGMDRAGARRLLITLQTEGYATMADRLWREATGIEPERPIVLYQGGFSVDRGVEELVAAATQPRLMELGTAIVSMGYGRLESLIAAAVASGVKNFIFSSTAAVYGAPREMPVKETTHLKPMSPYGSSKLMTEIMLRDTSFAHDFRHVALRSCRLIQSALLFSVWRVSALTSVRKFVSRACSSAVLSGSVLERSCASERSLARSNSSSRFFAQVFTSL